MRPAARTALEAALVFAACAVGFFALLQSLGPLLPDEDGPYHFEVASLILRHGPWVDISWLPFTVLGEHGPDHHWLFHALMAPLTALGHDHRAFNVASAVVAAAMPAAILPFLRRAQVPYAIVFAAAILFASTALPFRFLGLRAQTLAVVFMVATLFAMAWRRTVWVGVLAFLFTQAYHGAVILGLLLVATLAIQWLEERRVHFTLVTAVAIGVFAGLLASPWFPRNVNYLIFHTLFKTGSDDPFLVGGEWLRAPLAYVLRSGIVAHGVLASGLVAVAASAGRALPRLGRDTWAACIVTFVFLAMHVLVWRFVEYYAPFAIVASGLLWRDALRAAPEARWPRLAPAVVLALGLGWGIPHGIASIRNAEPRPFDPFHDMMAYIDAHDARPMVFNTNWSDFQQMVYASPRARYVAGLDGNYLRYGDPARFKVWYEFSAGGRLDRHDNASEIARTFGARWIMVNRAQPKLADNLALDPQAELVMARPAAGWLFEVKTAPR